MNQHFLVKVYNTHHDSRLKRKPYRDLYLQWKCRHWNEEKCVKYQEGTKLLNLFGIRTTYRNWNRQMLEENLQSDLNLYERWRRKTGWRLGNSMKEWTIATNILLERWPAKERLSRAYNAVHSLFLEKWKSRNDVNDRSVSVVSKTRFFDCIAAGKNTSTFENEGIVVDCSCCLFFLHFGECCGGECFGIIEL